MPLGTGVVCSRYGDLVKTVFFFFFFVVDPELSVSSSDPDFPVELAAGDSSVVPESDPSESSVPSYLDAVSLSTAGACARGGLVLGRSVGRGVLAGGSGVRLGVSSVSDESAGAFVIGIHVRVGLRAVGVGVRILSGSEFESVVDSGSLSKLCIVYTCASALTSATASSASMSHRRWTCIVLPRSLTLQPVQLSALANRKVLRCHLQYTRRSGLAVRPVRECQSLGAANWGDGNANAALCLSEQESQM